MTDLVCQRLATAALGFLLLAATTTSADAQIRIDRDQTGRTVAIVGLPTSDGCVRGSATGRVVHRKFEKGEMRGFTFNEPPYGDGYINLPAAYEIRDRAAYARVQAALNDLLRKGARLKITSVACGAGGRMIDLASATLLDDAPVPRAAPAAAPARGPAPVPNDQPASRSAGDTGVKMEDGDDSVLRAPDGSAVASAMPPAAQPPTQPQAAPQAQAPRLPQTSRSSRWRLSQPTKGQVNLEISSNDRAFGLALDCSRRNGRLLFSNWFLPPRNWNIAKSATPLSIDGRALRWEVDGADEGLVFSDSTVDNASALSANALDQLARGERLVVSGRTSRGKPRDAVFDIAGGEGSFAAFTERCQKLPRG
jgi:hypothetical protein